jgi:iron complex transport system substrate-binding protein
MKKKTKMLALLEIAIVLCSVFLVALPATAIAAEENDYVLGIYGNANEDDTIDMRDLTYVKLIFFGKKPETELSDAKYDGKINPLDFIQIKLIIVGKEKELTVVDTADRTVTIDKPVERIALLNGNLVDQIRAMVGTVDRIVGIPLGTDVVLYPELKDVSVVGSWDNPNYEMIIALDTDVVIPFTSWPPLPDEVQEVLAPAGIKVLGLDFYRVEVWYKELTTLGYILDTEERAEEYINFFQSWIDRIDEVVKDLEPEEKKTVYFEQEAKYHTYGGADYGCGIPGMVRDAGGSYIYDDFSEYGFEVDPEDLIDRNPDVIFKGTGVGHRGYTLTNTSELKEVRDEIMNRPELATVTAVKNGDVYAISWGVAGGKGKIFGPVYVAKCMYPDKFEDLEPNDYMKEYLEEWQGIQYQGVYIYPYPG